MLYNFWKIVRQAGDGLTLDSSNSPKAVLWDLDGTLIDSSPHHFAAWVEELVSRGRKPLTYQEFTYSFGQRNDANLRAWLDPQISDADIQAIGSSKEIRYRRMVREQGIPLLPGAESWLTRLHRQGWRQAVGTMAERENLNAVFDALRSACNFDPAVFGATVTGEEVKHGKPDPEVWLLAAQGLGVPPERCIVVEDAAAGVEGAHRAGMLAIGVGANTNLNADFTVPSLADLPEGIFHTLLYRTR